MSKILVNSAGKVVVNSSGKAVVNNVSTSETWVLNNASYAEQHPEPLTEEFIINW